MAGPLYADRALETSTTTGTGTYDLAGAVTGFQTLVAGIGNGNTCYYCAYDADVDGVPLGGWEVGLGTVTDATPDTLSRTTILASSNAGAAVNWGAGTRRIFVTIPAAASGRVVQVVNTQTGAMVTCATLIPVDDTIPQNTEGDEVMTLAITPRSATNVLLIQVQTFAACTGTPWISVALFQDATAGALAATTRFSSQTNGGGDSTLVHKMTAGTTSATTFKVRVGPTSGTATFNGSAGSRLFGGVMASSITITEIVP